MSSEPRILCRIDDWPVPEEILERLKSGPLDNPSKRLAKNREAWSMGHFLSFAAARELFRPPFEVIGADEPDLRVCEAGRVIGVEVAELVHPIEALARTEAVVSHGVV